MAARARSGEWVRVRPGAYVEAADARGGRRTMALARLVALRAQLTLPYWLSHDSAALLWGLPLLHLPTRAHVIQRSRPSRVGTSDVVRHIHEVPDEHLTTHRGHPVTTLERAVVDCAMSMSLLGGLVVADAALGLGADRETCRAILSAMPGRRGAPVARRVLDLADDGAESPGETAARLALVQAGLPVPETQVCVRTRFGDYWADLGWQLWRLLAEYDGRDKYRSGAEPAAAVVAEKRRQAAIEEAGWQVIRLVREDLHDLGALRRRVARFAPPGAVAPA